MDNILIEILSEEIPSSYQKIASDTISENLLYNMREVLKHDQQNLPFIETFTTCRRMAFFIKNFNISNFSSSNHNKEEEKVRGPRIGAPKTAIEGFMRKYKIAHYNQLEKKESFYYYTIPAITRKIQNQDENIRESKILLKKIIENSILEYTWPKSMHWANYNLRWIRPIKSIVCILNNEVLPIQIEHLKASNKTLGHRFMSQGYITIDHPTNYEKIMSESYVIASPSKRQQIIKNGIDQIFQNNTTEIIEDPKLLDEIANLVEYPVILVGKIEQEFMWLPKEVLVTTLKHHQKYMMLVDQEDKLAPYFIIVSNIKAIDGGKSIIKGNEKVLKTRLKDAAFFINYDRKSSLESKKERLHKLLFHKKIGTMYDKTERIKELVTKISQDTNLDVDKAKRAAELMKNDLTTEMVSEFPTLQGVMGYYYALWDGEDNEVAEAIKDHYKPQGIKDGLPNTKLGAILAIADKLDTLNTMFSINIKPSGSKDPYALRRAAIGIARIINSHKIILSLPLYGLREDVINFIKDKSINALKEKDFEGTDFVKESLG